MLFTHGWLLEPTPSAPQRWEHCRWGLIQILNSISLSSPLWTCIVAGESTNSSVSSHSLNHLSSWVLAARNKPLNTVLPFRPKGMAKSQRGRLAWSPESVCKNLLSVTSQSSPAAPAEALPKFPLAKPYQINWA